MLITIRLLDTLSNKLVLKKINNFIVIMLGSGSHIYTIYKYWKLWKNYFVYTFIIYFIRIVWRGKAYRVRFFKKSSKFTFNFGHSHWYKLLYDNSKLSFFRIRRQSYLAFALDRFDARLVKNFFNTIRVYNKYTRRGIRVKRAPYIRRFGKISQVNSILHSF